MILDPALMLCWCFSTAAPVQAAYAKMLQTQSWFIWVFFFFFFFCCCCAFLVVLMIVNEESVLIYVCTSTCNDNGLLACMWVYNWKLEVILALPGEQTWSQNFPCSVLLSLTFQLFSDHTRIKYFCLPICLCWWCDGLSHLLFNRNWLRCWTRQTASSTTQRARWMNSRTSCPRRRWEEHVNLWHEGYHIRWWPIHCQNPIIHSTQKAGCVKIPSDIVLWRLCQNPIIHSAQKAVCVKIPSYIVLSCVKIPWYIVLRRLCQNPIIHSTQKAVVSFLGRDSNLWFYLVVFLVGWGFLFVVIIWGRGEMFFVSMKEVRVPGGFQNQESKWLFNFEKWESFLHFWESTTWISINSLLHSSCRA